MYKCEREEEILSLLNETEYATIEYLAKKMNISASSIRRDLKNLEERALVKRSYGGVRIAQSTGKKIPFSLRSHENSDKKKQIAKAAVDLVNEGDVIFLDGSSSAFFASAFLTSVRGVTVITNNIDALSYFSGYDIKVLCTGGTVSPENKAVLVGGYTQDFVRQIHADVAIFSVQAVARNGNFYDCYAEEVAVRNIMFQNAKKRILLCDSTKLGKVSTYYQGNLRDVDTLVCDLDPTPYFDTPYPEKFVF